MNKDKISFLKHDKEIIVDELLYIIKELEAKDLQIEELKKQLTLNGVVNSMPTFKDINELEVGETIFETENYKILKR